MKPSSRVRRSTFITLVLPSKEAAASRSRQTCEPSAVRDLFSFHWNLIFDRTSTRQIIFNVNNNEGISSISALPYSPTSINVFNVRFKKKEEHSFFRNSRFGNLKILSLYDCWVEDPEHLAIVLSYLSIEMFSLSSSNSCLPLLVKLCFPRRSTKTFFIKEIYLFDIGVDRNIFPLLVVGLQNCHSLVALTMWCLNYRFPEQFALLVSRWGYARDSMFHELPPEQLFCLSRPVSTHAPEAWALTG